MKEHHIHLDKITDATGLNYIHGGETGEAFAIEYEIVKHLVEGDKIIIHINKEKILAINDTFIKGLFASVFKIFKTKQMVSQQVEVRGRERHIRLFNKNWELMEAIEIP